MLSSRCFTLEWIAGHGKRLKCRDSQLVEKCIVAFELVGRLSAAGLDFVFKGGTSLLLHLRPIRRLSIDADITTNAKPGEIQQVLRQVTSSAFPASD
jgi:predicted nucleotidyltransferase component of viral defense system